MNMGSVRMKLPIKEEVPLTGRKVKFLVFAPIMGYKWFKVFDTVNAPLTRAPISPQ